jgi:hypothetical protein
MDERYRLSGLEMVGWGDGDIGYFVIANGRAVFTRLAIPADWAEMLAAGTPYVLSIAGGYPAWARGTAVTLGSGYGNNYGNDYGGPA